MKLLMLCSNFLALQAITFYFQFYLLNKYRCYLQLLFAIADGLGEKTLLRRLPKTTKKISDAEWPNILKSLAPKADNLNAKPIEQSNLNQLEQNSYWLIIFGQFLGLERRVSTSTAKSSEALTQLWDSFRGRPTLQLMACRCVEDLSLRTSGSWLQLIAYWGENSFLKVCQEYSFCLELLLGIAGTSFSIGHEIVLRWWERERGGKFFNINGI